MTDKQIVLIPKDVDDPNGYGVEWALRSTGISRDEHPALADAIEEAWWHAYQAATTLAVEAAGHTVMLTGYIGSPEFFIDARNHAADTDDDDTQIGQIVDMTVVNHRAEEAFNEWWSANAERLVAEHATNEDA